MEQTDSPGTPGFYTLKGYQHNDTVSLTSSMEDYLEMICRLMQTREIVRINELAENLHVKPSSASKMAGNLKQGGFVDYEKYGYIRLTEKGRQAGDYLLYRHRVLHQFLCMVNHTDNELEQVEKIEHFINPATVHNIRRLLDSLGYP